jgi:transposase
MTPTGQATPGEIAMESEQHQAAKKQMMVLMQEGYRWQEAASRAGIRISRSTAYRWFQQFRTQGEAGLHDGRHGHIAKMHQPIREWLEARCREEPSLPSSSLRKELNAHFDVLVSITRASRQKMMNASRHRPHTMVECDKERSLRFLYLVKETEADPRQKASTLRRSSVYGLSRNSLASGKTHQK